MVVVHVQDHFYPQLGYQESFLMRAQAKLGHDVHMVTANRHYYAAAQTGSLGAVLGERVVPAGVEHWEGTTIHRLPCRWAFLDRFSRRWLEGLEQKVADLRPDLVIMHGMQSLTAFRLARAAKTEGHDYRIIFDSHADEVVSNRPLRGVYYGLYRLLTRSLFIRKADGIVALNENGKRFLAEMNGIPESRISIIPLGADAELFSFDPSARREMRATWGARDEDVVFIYTGKVAAYKGVHYMIEAARAAVPQFPNILLVVVGGGEAAYLGDLKRRAAAPEGVRTVFHGHVQNRELPRFYSGADVSVWPDWLSIGTLEAQSCGLPLIVSDCSPIMEQRVAYGNGVVYSRGEVADLATKMVELAEDPSLRRAMGARGRRAIEEELNWDVIAEEFMRLAGTTLRNAG